MTQGKTHKNAAENEKKLLPNKETEGIMIHVRPFFGVLQ